MSPLHSEAQGLIANSFVYIKLLNLSDGSPYCAPPLDVITWELPPRLSSTFPKMFAITGSRIVMYISYRDPDLPRGDRRVWRLCVWDWKTGDLVRVLRLHSHVLFILPPQVLDLSTTKGHGFIRRGDWFSPVVFIDEFRLLVLTYDNPTGDPELVVFNTLVPQDHPSNSRRFGVPDPSGSHDWTACIYVDRDRSLGAPNIDDPFVADPAQAILVMKLINDLDLHVLVVVRTQALIQLACSPHAGSHVPWDEWGEGAVFVGPQKYNGDTSIFIHGTKMMVTHAYRRILQGPPSFCVHTFDFNRRERDSLTLSNEDCGVTESTSFPGGKCFSVKASEGMDPWSSLDSLGDGSLFYLVS